jgi:transketolase
MEDIAVASSVPNMSVVAPCDPAEMRLMTRWCAEESSGPVYMRLGKVGEKNFTLDSADPFIAGKIRYLKRGNDLAILTYGITVTLATTVATELEELGKSISLISVHTLKPLDKNGIELLLKSHKQVVVIEEHVPHGGLGSRVKEIAWDMRSSSHLEVFSLKDEFIHCYGSHDELLEKHGLSKKIIMDKLVNLK